MTLSQRDLRAIVAAASTIPERVSSHGLPGNEQANDDVLQARLNAWCQVSTAGDWQRFQERLSWDGLDFAGAYRLLASREWPEEVPLPGWTVTLQEALQLLEALPGEGAFASAEPWSCLDANAPLPFEELLAPFVAVARRGFLTQAAAATNLLTDAAQLTLQRHLLQVLISMSLPTLQAAFVQSRAQAARDNEQRDSTEFSRYFLQQMRQGGLAALLRSYSALARLLATTCDLWVEANVEFVYRLAADWSDLGEVFGTGNDLGQVAEIQPALSDTHAGRRCVMALTFACGTRLIYKPRPIGIEEAYTHLLRWCNAQGAAPPLKTLAMLNRVSYGWVEFVAQEPCPDREALRRYYQRAGMLLCLVYILGGMNCFSDQFVAHGEQPVLVDASHLLRPYPRQDLPPRQGRDWEQEVYSVLHTGLLASWKLPTGAFAASSKGTRHYAGDISGLCLSQRDKDLAQEDRERQLSKSPPALKYGSLKAHPLLNVARSVDVSQRPCEADLQEDLCAGFQHMYQLFLQQRATLLAPRSPLQALKTQLVRMTYRDRAVYDDLLPTLLAPQALQDAITHSMLLEGLGVESAPLDWTRASKGDHARWWPVFAAERQALLQGDIPVVSARADSDTLVIGPEQEVGLCLCQSAFDLVLRRLERLSDKDLALQLGLLQQALPQETTQVESPGQVVETGEQPEAGTFMRQALAIADDIARRAVEIGQESVLWVGATGSYRFQQSQLQPLRYGFSDGVSGIAFFLAALAQLTGITSYRRLALAAVRPLHRLVRQEGERLVCEMGLGAGLGLGSVVYALTRLSQFLDEPELLAEAGAAASLITRDLIADDHLLDVFVGTAGALLGLLALYEVSPTQDLLDRAIWCGEHLLHTRTPSKTPYRAWPTVDGRHTTGFAHGTAGIGYALLRLYALTGDAALLEAAQEGLRYEDQALVREAGNWAEEVGKKETDYVSWCHGAPGIGLARIGNLPLLDTASNRQDIEMAIQTTQQIGAGGSDHLCCGICGRAEFLLTAARRLNRPELTAMAVDIVGQMLTRAEQRGAFTFDSVLPRWIARPQFFYGTAGIGYTLLRLAQPDVLPSPLLWE